MSSQELIEKVKSLSPEEQASVSQFIDDLGGHHVPASTPSLQAAERFMAEHPELLRRLSQ